MDAFNDFLGYKELTNLSSKTIVEFFNNLGDIDSLVESLYALSEQELLLSANLTIANKIDAILDHIEGVSSRRYDDESDNLHMFKSVKIAEPLEISEESKILVSKLRSRLDYTFSLDDYDRECVEVTYVNEEMKKRELPKKKLFAPSLTDITAYAERDFDVLNLILNRPELLGAMDAKYVLATINKIVSDYPDTFKNPTFRANLSSYLETDDNIVCNKADAAKITDMFMKTKQNVLDLLDPRIEKKLTNK